MQWQLSPSVIAEAGTALGFLMVAVFFHWHDLNHRANLIGHVLLTIAALWILTHSLEIGTPVASYKAYLMGLQLIWGLIAMTLWLMYIIQYSAIGKWRTNRIYILFGVMPLLAIISLATNHIYGLLWTAPGLDINNPYLPLEPTYGLFYWVCMAYVGALVAWGIFLVLKTVVRQHNFRRWEPWPLILSSIIPLLSAFLEVTKVVQPAGLTIGITPFFSGIGIIIMVWSLPRFHLGKIIPVARDTVFERISDCVIVLNAQNRIVDLNPAAEHLAGYTSSEALGLPVEQIWPNWPSQSVPSEAASTVFKELVLTCAGEQRAYELYIYTISDQNKRLLNKVALMVDATERKQAMTVLKESEQRYRTLFESAVEGIIIADVKTRKFIHANPAICALLGYSQEELTRMSVSDIHPKTSLEYVFAEFDAQVRGEKIFSTLPCLKKDGTIFYADITSTKAIIDGRECNIGFFTDITARKLAEVENLHLREKAEMSSRLAAVGEMAAGIAHEINNPLTSVIGFSELLMEKQDLPSDVKEELKSIFKGSNRVKDIVRRMLTFARPTKPDRTGTSINELIVATLDLRSYVLRTANIEVVKHLDPELPWIVADPGQMQQVFLNLIVNAEFSMKKAHGRGILAITTEKMDNHIHISFKDDGTGMSKEVEDKLFNPFFTTKDIGEGTGLGLSLSRSIITEHGGTIEVESDPGKGANFIITLPITSTAEDAPAKAGVANTVPPEKVKAAHILVVDDEEDIRKLLSTILTKSGHTVETTGDVREAAVKMDSISYDVVLADIRMPGMSGVELYNNIKPKHPELKGRFIFITGDTSDAQIRDFLEQNKLSYITKPFDMETLLKQVNRLL
jgi:PAS domain S-box-containing protein